MTDGRVEGRSRGMFIERFKPGAHPDNLCRSEARHSQFGRIHNRKSRDRGRIHELRVYPDDLSAVMKCRRKRVARSRGPCFRPENRTSAGRRPRQRGRGPDKIGRDPQNKSGLAEDANPVCFGTGETQSIAFGKTKNAPRGGHLGCGLAPTKREVRSRGPTPTENVGVNETQSFRDDTQKEIPPKRGDSFCAGPTRLELATSCVTGRRSNQAELRPRLDCKGNHCKVPLKAGLSYNSKYLLQFNIHCLLNQEEYWF